MPQLSLDAPSADPLHGEVVVFVGRLWSLARRDARAAVERLGGVVDDDLSTRTTMVVAGGDAFPNGVPAVDALAADTSTTAERWRRAVALAQDAPARVRLVDERTFCRQAGLVDFQDQRQQIYGQRDMLAMYPLLRDDHLRTLQKWGVIRPVFRNDADTWFGFADLTTVRQVHAALQQGRSLRAVWRDLQAARAGQLALDFDSDAAGSRVVDLGARRRMAQSAEPSGSTPHTDSTLTTAEQYFLMGSILDDGGERTDEAALAYRRALELDPDLVAALINLANLRYAKDERAEAQALYERAIGLDPTYFEAHFNLGNIHHDHERYADAAVCYREALALQDDYADAHFYLAVTLEKMGRPADAQPHWQRYKALAPDGEWIELAREFTE
ncbi:MAG: tetratricopeptide repeat protein [Acidobacteria bacterium]|nr:tetratricopeptide repeat protein [Acidobacteriota bacterium]